MISPINPKSAIRNPQSAIRYSAIFVAFIAMLFVSWRRWTSPIADSGREMDLPLRLLRGEMLYRDVSYLYPPFSPYFNSQLYRFFGAHLDVLHASAIVCSAIIVALCYRIARRLLLPAEAAIASVAVIFFCIFKPAGNLISPYAFAALHGMIFALGALLMTLRIIRLRIADCGLRIDENPQSAIRNPQSSNPQSSNPRSAIKTSLIGAGALIGLAAITKQEFALTAALTVIAGLIYLHRSKIKRLTADLLVVGIPAAMIALPVYGLLFYLIGWQTLVEDCHLFYTHLPASLVFYNKHRTGLDHPLFSLMQMLGATAVAVAALSAIVLLSDRTRRTMNRAGVVFAVSLLAVFAIKLLSGKQWDGGPLRALPILLLAFVVFEWRRRKSDGAALFIISAYSLAILARVSLRVPSGGAFGGYFLPTSLIIFCYLFLRALPQTLERWTKDRLSAQRAKMIGQGLLILLLIVAAIVFSIRFRKNFNFEIKAERGHFFAPKSSGREINEALKFIEQETKPGEAIVVLPEGSDLAFLTGRRAPLRHQILIPGLMSEKDEQDAIAKLQQEQVHYVLIVNRPMREFGAEAFGRDFYTTLGRWIDDHYRIVKVIGAPAETNLQIGDPRFFIKVLQRRD